MSNQQTIYTEQPAVGSGPEQNNDLSIFFGIGVVVNIAMITAYFIWAYKQWKKGDRRDP